MSQPVAPPHFNASPDDVAALWLLRHDRGLDVEHDPDFIAWRDGAPAHAAAWAHAVAVWEAVGQPAADDPLMAALRRDALQARPKRMPMMAAVAAVAVAILSVVLAWPQLTTRFTAPAAQPGPPADAAATFAVASGPPDSFALPDGSQVTLNANSAVAVAYTGRGRGVRLLRGQAYFSVVHDEVRPFTVAAQARTITDLGTEFDVRLGGEAVTVTLVKGAVAVSPEQGRKQVELTSPGQQLTASPGQPDKVAQVDLKDALSWRAGMLEFSETPLAEAVAKINRFGGPPVKLVDPAAAAMRVSGQFRAGEPTRFAKALAAAYPLKVRIRADGGADISSR